MRIKVGPEQWAATEKAASGAADAKVAVTEPGAKTAARPIAKNQADGIPAYEWIDNSGVNLNFANAYYKTLATALHKDANKAIDDLLPLFTGDVRPMIKEVVTAKYAEKGNDLQVADIYNLFSKMKRERKLTSDGNVLYETLFGSNWSKIADKTKEEIKNLFFINKSEAKLDKIVEEQMEFERQQAAPELPQGAFRGSEDLEEPIVEAVQGAAKVAEKTFPKTEPKKTAQQAKTTPGSTPEKKLALKRIKIGMGKKETENELSAKIGKTNRKTEKILNEMEDTRGEGTSFRSSINKDEEVNTLGWSFDEIIKDRTIQRLKKEMPKEEKIRYQKDMEYAMQKDKELAEAAVVEMMGENLPNQVFVALKKKNMTWEEAWSAKNKLDEDIFKLLNKDASLLKTASVKKFRSQIEENIKKHDGTNTYAEGFWKTMDAGLKLIFGKDYDALKSFVDKKTGKRIFYNRANAYFSQGSAKGKSYYKQLREQLNRNNMPERQPKDVLEETASKIMKEGKPWSSWKKGENKDIYGKREEELIKQAEEYETIKKPAKQKEGEVTEAQEARELGLRMTKEDQAGFIHDLSKLDNIMRIKTASELPTVKTNARGGASDAYSYLVNLLSVFNQQVGTSKKIWVDPKKLKALMEKFPANVFSRGNIN